MTKTDKTRIPSAVSTTATLLLSTTSMTALSLAAMTALSAPALAQSDGATLLEEIQVTGTRIRRSDFDTPNPTTVVDNTYLQNLGLVNLGDAMIQIPSNVSTFTPQATGNSNFFAGSTIANLRGINPFFGSRTLTLIDGKRHVPTNQGDGVDLNFIPTILLERMDVVTGGASAAYGSGAVSGVNNIILNKRLEGFKLDLDYGITGHGDGDNYHGAGAWGTALFEEKGHFVIAGEYQKQEQVGCLDARKWCSQNIGFLNNANGQATNGNVFTPYDPSKPQYYKVSDIRSNALNQSGVFWNAWVPNNPAYNPAQPISATNSPYMSAPTQVYQVNADGTTTSPFTIGQAQTALDAATGTVSSSGIATNQRGNVQGGDGTPLNQYTNLIGETERYTTHAHFDYDVTDSINFGLDGEYGKVKTDNPGGALASQAATIAADNAYVMGNPQLEAARALSQANTPAGPFGPASATINKDWTSQLDPHSTFDTEVWSIAGELNGEITDTSWTWNAYVTHGHTHRTQTVFDNPHLNSLNYALDAVFPYNVPGDPASGLNTSADPICRATRGDFIFPPVDPTLAAGCVPINPFGTDPIPQDALDYAFGYLQEDTIVNQTVAAASITGDLFEGFGAGPVGVAVGGEYRWEDIKNLNNSKVPATDYLIQYGDSFFGKVNVWETYGEVNVPLLADKPFFESLSVDGAIRYSKYKNTGQGPSFLVGKHGLTTWKVSGIWDVYDWFRIRGSQSRDARAGNFRELYYGQLIHAGGIFGYCGGGFADPCDINLQGNPDLSPEVSDTSTIGAVFTPTGALQGLQFAADYYHIRVKNGITPAGGPIQQNELVAACRADPASDACGGAVVFDDPTNLATSGIASITQRSYNARTYAVKGIDFSVNYNHMFDNGDSISSRLIATKTISQYVQTVIGNEPINIVGQTGAANGFLPDFQSSPDWTANLSVTYNTGGFSGTVQGRYTSGGVYDFYGKEPGDLDYEPNVSPSYTDNKIGFYQVYSLNLSYTFEDLIGADSSLQVFANVNNLFDKNPDPVGSAVYFDRLGRAFRFGIRSQF